MRNVSNDIVATLIRTLPVLIDNVDTGKGGLRLQNAVRMANKCIKKLKKIEQNGK